MPDDRQRYVEALERAITMADGMQRHALYPGQLVQGENDVRLLRQLRDAIERGQEGFQLGRGWAKQDEHQRVTPAVLVIPLPENEEWRG